jgi:CheY-like chemotaxis protein
MAQECILIVEDEADVRKGISLFLEWKGYDVIAEENGAQALKKVQTLYSEDKHIDLLICDYAMPVMNGEQFLSKLKECNISIPTLVMTGCKEKSIAGRMKNLGGLNIIEKPFDASLLERYVSSLLKDPLTKVTFPEQSSVLGE